MDLNHFFDSAHEAQEFAKTHPGVVVSRVQNSNRYAVQTSDTIKHPHVNPKSKRSSCTPSDILEHLNKHVISQDDAKKEIALALYYHHLKIQQSASQHIKNNGSVMLVGPTGTGKTFIIKKACEYMNMLYVNVDASSLVPEGIVGFCISDLIADILQKASYNLAKASHCVIFFDEVDKLFTSDKTTEYGQKVANQMLKMIEGEKIKLSSPKTIGDVVLTELDTTNMQFIFGGAFQWILDGKKESKSTMGFIPHKVIESDALSIEDLYANGVAKEFLGRINTVVNLKSLSLNNIYDILTKSESSPLKKYIDKIKMHGCTVCISEETLQKVAQESANNPLGVRSIDFTLKRIFKDALFTAPEGRVKQFDIILKL